MEKHFCQYCKGPRKHVVLFEKKLSGEEAHHAFQWMEKYQVIECAGCEHISFLKVYGDSSMFGEAEDGELEYYYDKQIYPYYLKKGEELLLLRLIPENIRNIYSETISAFKAGSLLLTAGGFRAIIEATCNFLKIRKDSLEERINQLHLKGHLTQSESKRLHSVRFLGNDALHEIETPKPEQLEILLGIINHLLSNLFISDKLIKGKLDIPVDTYEDFTRLIQNLVKKDMLGKELPLKEILGKTRRLISNKQYKVFLQQFISDIQGKKHGFLEITDQEKEIFKIVAEPKMNFAWDIMN